MYIFKRLGESICLNYVIPMICEAVKMIRDDLVCAYKIAYEETVEEKEKERPMRVSTGYGEDVI